MTDPRRDIRAQLLHLVQLTWKFPNALQFDLFVRSIWYLRTCRDTRFQLPRNEQVGSV